MSVNLFFVLRKSKFYHLKKVVAKYKRNWLCGIRIIFENLGRRQFFLIIKEPNEKLEIIKNIFNKKNFKLLCHSISSIDEISKLISNVFSKKKSYFVSLCFLERRFFLFEN
jgi:hypothetical protein